MNDSFFSTEIFKNPGAEYAPTYAWVWNTTITRDGIDEQLSDFLKAGIRSFYIIPFPDEFRPLIMKTELRPRYLSEDFFELISYALHRATELAMVVWIYDEGGWPSGGACGHTLKENPEAATDVLESRTVTIRGGEIYRAAEGTIASFIGKKRIFDGEAPTEDAEVTEYFTVPKVENGNRVDCTNAGVTETFIKNTYEPYKKSVGDLFGNKLPIIFTDEPGQMPCSIPKHFFALFEKEYGYDLRDRLYAVTDPLCEDEADRRARIDYARLIGKLMRDCMFKPLADWCEKNGVAFGGHLDNEHVPHGGTRNGYFSHLDCLRTFAVPGIDVIWNQIVYPTEDTVPMAEGSTFFPRIAPSAARQSGRKIALSETFSVYGESFYPNEARYVVGYQAIRGINAFNFMAIPYGKKRMQALAMRPGFCKEKPGFYHLRALNDYTARLSYLGRLGEAMIDTALYFPAADFAASAETSAKAGAFYNAMGENLEAEQIGFDMIDDNGILSAIDEGDGLRIGNAKYSSIYIPKCDYMPTDVYKIAKKYEKKGERLLPIRDPKLRTSVRKIGDDLLWFFFSENALTRKECIPIPDGKRAYRLNLVLGEIFSVEGDTIEIAPAIGETEVYLITNRAFEATKNKSAFKATVEEFTPLSMDKFTVFEGGIRKERMDIPEKLPHDLSAEITYAFRYSLPEAPRKGEIYRFTLENTRYTASIQKGDEVLCVFGPSPMVALVDGEKLEKQGELTVTVANTASGEIAKKREVIEDFYPVEEQGVYARRKMYALEARFDPPKLGSLTIEKMV